MDFADLVPLIVIGGIIYVLLRLSKKLNKPAQISCPNCSYKGEGKTITKGNTSTELLLYILMILPGLIYSLWRIGSRYLGCPKCNYQYVVKE